MKKVIPVVLAVVMALFCVACNNNTPVSSTSPSTAPSNAVSPNASTPAGDVSPSAAPPTGNVSPGAATPGGVKSTKDTLVIANCAGEPANIDPYNSNSAPAATVLLMVMEPVLRPDPDGGTGLAPVLAKSWDVTKDSITFHLRDDVNFSDGTHMTAADVVFSFQTCMKSTQYSNFFSSVDVDNIKATDDTTVVVPLKAEDAFIINNFNIPFICHQDTYESMGDDFAYKPVGTGPFTVGNWEVGDHIDLNRNANYWGGDVALSKVVVRTVSEPSQALIGLENNEFDLIMSPGADDVASLQSSPVSGVKLVTWDTAILRNNNIRFNYNSDLGSNLAIRQAVASCVDRESWYKIISPGVGQPSYSPITPAIIGWTDNSQNYPYKYSIDQAKQYLAQAGYPNGVKLTILTDSRAYHQALIELLQNSCAQAGITLDVQTMELPTQQAQMATGEGFDMYLLDTVGALGQPLNQIWEDSNPQISKIFGFNMNQSGAQEYLDILNQIHSCYDQTQLVQLVGQMQQIFNQNLVWITVNTIQGYFIATENLQNLHCKADVLLVTADTYFS